MNIVIIGAGKIGMALHNVLINRKNVTVRLWDKNASIVPDQKTLDETIKDTEIVFLCLPSWTLRAALTSIRSCVTPTMGIIALSKGIEQETCKTSDALLQEFFPNHPVGVLGGPMIADELMSGKETVGVLGTHSAMLRKLTKKLFKNTVLHISATNDMRGVSLCGVLKNAYTLVLGIGEGLGLGDNAKGAFMSHAMEEMTLIVKMLGGKGKTVLGAAGLGDLYATSTSQHSRNRMVGVALANGTDGNLASEGLMSLHCLQKMLTTHLEAFNLLNHLVQVTKKAAEPSSLLQYLL